MKRTLIAAALALSPVLALPGPQAFAQSAGGCAATETMRGGKNNYIAGAPRAENLGAGFVVTGTVREAGSCAPLAHVRVQVWTATERGGEREPTNRGSVVTDAEGKFRLETSPIVPQFGQAHIHVAYDDPGFEPVFLRPVLKSRNDTSITVDINLSRSTDAPKS